MSTLFWLTMIKNKLGHKLKGMSYCESLECLRFIMGCDKKEMSFYFLSLGDKTVGFSEVLLFDCLLIGFQMKRKKSC